MKNIAIALACLMAAVSGWADTMKIMSFNVCHCSGMDGKVDLERTARAIRAADPDFACLQELDCRTERSKGVDQPAELGRLAGLHPTFARAIPFQGGEYGVMILSRKQPLDVVKLPLPGKEPRVLLLCEFADCVVGTTHLSVAAESERVQSVDIIRRAIAAYSGKKPVFLTGDWNSLPDDPVLAGLGKFLKVVSDTECQTYHGSQVRGRDGKPLDMSRFCIDYIACDRSFAKSFRVIDAHAVRDRATSDHAPIVVTLRGDAALGIAGGSADIRARIEKAGRTIRRVDKFCGFDRVVFDFDGCEAWVVCPKDESREGMPWTWTMQWATAYVPRTNVPQMLAAGCHHVTIDTFSRRMDAEGLKVSAAFQRFLVEKLGFAERANLIGMSWGGFFSIRYAANYPGNVSRIYLDCPLLTFSGFAPADAPTEAAKLIGSWAGRMPHGGDWSGDSEMPVNMAGVVARAGIPILLAYGGQDRTVNPDLNSRPFIERFKAAGGNIRVMYRPLYGHHPHGIEVNEKAIMDFFDNPVADVFERYVAAGRIAGVVSVLGDDDFGEHYECAGYADLERRRKMTPDTVFAVFSMSKTFLGSAIMCAIDEGRMSLDDEVAKYFPEFADVKMKDGSLPKRRLTIRDLTSHVTGSRFSYGCVNRDIPLKEVAHRLASIPLEAQPGETFRYGNAWIDTAAACIEVVTGEKYEDYLQRKIIGPLGMKDTTFWPNEEQQQRMVKAYTSDDGPLRPGADGCVAQLEFPKRTKIYPSPSGGLFSTPRDMVRFSQMLAHHGEWKGRRLISRKTFDGVFAVKQTPAGVTNPYTCGSWIYGDWFGHEGAMRTDQRANLRTGQCRVFFIQTENLAGSAFFNLKRDWHAACDKVQHTPSTVFGN